MLLEDQKLKTSGHQASENKPCLVKSETAKPGTHTINKNKIIIYISCFLDILVVVICEMSNCIVSR